MGTHSILTLYFIFTTKLIRAEFTVVQKCLDASSLLVEDETEIHIPENFSSNGEPLTFT